MQNLNERQKKIEYPNGSVEYCTLVDGVKQGKAKLVWKDGQEEYTYVNGVRQGEAVIYYDTLKENKELLTYVNGVKQGKAVYHYYNGDKVEYTYIDEELQGKYIYTFANGDILTSYFVDEFDLDEATRREEKEDGKIAFTWDDKHLLECTLVDGVPQGEAVMIHLPINTREEFTFVDGIKQGKARFIWKDGQEEYTYVNGVKEGVKLLDSPNDDDFPFGSDDDDFPF